MTKMMGSFAVQRQAGTNASDLRPERFHPSVSPEEIEDLRDRIGNTRWPTDGPGRRWERGAPVEYMAELAEHWRQDFDWPGFVEDLNRHPSYRAEIDGLPIHFQHVRSERPDARPIILTHGWPSSFLEFSHVIDDLVDPRDETSPAFHVVVPSLPGFGYSGVPHDEWTLERTARAWAALMQGLGYTQYVAQGGDWGFPISLLMAETDPEGCAGVHLNMLVTFPPPDFDGDGGLSDVEKARLANAAGFAADGLGYARILSTRPQTVAYSMVDSPAALLAWIVEKFYEWSDSEADPEDAFDRAELLRHASLYWFTGTGGSSPHIYRDNTHTEADFAATWGGPWKVGCPVGVSVFPQDATPPIKSFAEHLLPTLSTWVEHESGGHFAALERPGELVDDVRAFAARLPRGQAE